MKDLAQINQLEELQEFAAQHGIKLTNADYTRIAEARDRARAEHRAQEKTALAWHERLNTYLPSMQKAVLNVSMFMFVALRMIATTFLIPLVLLLVAVVETVRVAHGLELFEASVLLAYAGAVALVLSNVVLEFNITDIEHRAGYRQERQTVFSLRILASQMAYMFGLGEGWRAALHSPARRFHLMARWLKMAILLLAVAGSMKPMFETLNGNWRQGLGQLLEQSTLLQLITWGGGLIFAWVVVSLTSTFTSYVAELAIEAESAMPEYNTGDEEAYVSRQAAMELKTIIAAKRQPKESTRPSAAVAQVVNFAAMNTDEEDTDEVATIRPT